MNAHEKVLNLLSTINKGVDLKDELQTEIDPSIYFRRNSVNLLVGKKGSGKTYNVFREVLKLKFVDNHHYTKMLYITNKPYDPTFRRIKDLLPITVEKITYDQAVEKINELSEAKKAIMEIKDHNINTDDLDHQELDQVLGTDITGQGDVFHSIVLLDDCQFLFEKRTRENLALWKLLFENRQPKITYFLTLQDPKGLDSSIKEALDSVWVFGGFTQMKFNYIMRNIPHEHDTYDVWVVYRQLTKNQAVVFTNTESGTTAAILKC